MSVLPTQAAWVRLRALLVGGASTGQPSAARPDEVADAARVGGVVRLAAAADPAVSAALDADVRQRTYAALCVEAALERLAGVLTRLGLAEVGGAALLKGSATAALVYEDPLARERRDVDLLVAPEHFPKVAEALAMDGWAPTTSAAWWAVPERRHEVAYRLAVGPSSVECDVHRRLSAFRAWPVDHRGLLARAVQPRGALLPVTSPEDTLLHTAMHAMTGGFTVPLRSWLDLALLAARPGLDWAAVTDRARAWGLEVAVWAALGVVQRWFATPVPAEVTRRLAPSRTTALTLSRLLSGDGETPLAHPSASAPARLLASGGPLLRAKLLAERFGR